MTTYTLGVLCGGQGSRMGGGDKGWLPYKGSSFVESAIGRFRCESLPMDSVIVSANRNCQRYQGLGVQVVRDLRPGYKGPLAGLEAILTIANPDQPLLLLPCDMPELPEDLAMRLIATLYKATPGTIVIANDGERAQPLCMALYPAMAYPHLKQFLDGGERGVFHWLKQHRLREVPYSDHAHRFCNVNEPLAYQALVSHGDDVDRENNAPPMYFGYDPRHESHRTSQFAPTP